MRTVINIKTDRKIKTEAQKIAAKMGLSLSSVINAYLRQFVTTKTLHLTLDDEVPSPKLIRAIKEAEEDYKKGNVYTANNMEEFIAHLNSLDNKKRKK